MTICKFSVIMPSVEGESLLLIKIERVGKLIFHIQLYLYLIFHHRSSSEWSSLLENCRSTVFVSGLFFLQLRLSVVLLCGSLLPKTTVQRYF